MQRENTREIEIQVHRPFYWKGEVQARGTTLRLPEKDALYLIHVGKASRVPAPGPEPPEAALAPEAEIPETRGRRRAVGSRAETD